jgi:hypothetical protein
MFRTIAAVLTTERGCACVRARRKSAVKASYNRGCVINSKLAVCTGAAQTKVDRAGAEQ